MVSVIGYHERATTMKRYFIVALAALALAATASDAKASGYSIPSGYRSILAGMCRSTTQGTGMRVTWVSSSRYVVVCHEESAEGFPATITFTRPTYCKIRMVGRMLGRVVRRSNVNLFC